MDKSEYIPTISMPDNYQILTEQYINHGKSALIKNYWPDGFLDNYIPSALREIFRDDKLKVNLSNDRRFALDAKTGKSLSGFEVMDINTVMDKAEKGDTSWYLQQMSVKKHSELFKYFQTPGILSEQTIEAVNFWLGLNGTSPLHYDFGNNFLCQLHGSKKLTIYHPKYCDELYPYPISSPVPHLSRARIDNPGDPQFTKFSEIEGIQVTINAGDILFMPSCTWHEVENEGLSAAVNIWWPMHAEQIIYDGFTRFLSKYYPELISIFNGVNKTLVSNFQSLVKYSLKNNATKAANVLACAFLENTIRQKNNRLNASGLNINEMKNWLFSRDARNSYKQSEIQQISSVFENAMKTMQFNRKPSASDLKKQLSNVSSLTSESFE